MPLQEGNSGKMTTKGFEENQLIHVVTYYSYKFPSRLNLHCVSCWPWLFEIFEEIHFCGKYIVFMFFLILQTLRHNLSMNQTIKQSMALEVSSVSVYKNYS